MTVRKNILCMDMYCAWNKTPGIQFNHYFFSSEILFYCIFSTKFKVNVIPGSVQFSTSDNRVAQ